MIKAKCYLDKKPHVIHLCSYYVTSKLYRDFFESLDDKVLSQKIFVPFRSTDERDKFKSENLKKGSYVYSKCMSKCLRVSLFLKLTVFFISLYKNKKALGILECDFIHCHTLFSDGGVGWFLNILWGKKYSVTIRNTDLNIYLRYFPHLRYLAKLIVKRASKVIFISPAYKIQCFNKYPNIFYQSKGKNLVIPNGVNSFWKENMRSKDNKERESERGSIKLLFVGDFSTNKNLRGLASACGELSREKLKVDVKLVGNNLYYSNCYGIFSEDIDVVIEGVVKEKKHLAQLMYEADVLVVPSFTETFGLVYVEALSQGTSIVFSENQGPDGFFSKEECFSVSCDPHDSKSIAKAICKSSRNSPTENQQKVILEKFDWYNISDIYLKKIYQ